jgi:hypothetical protein
MICTIGRSEGGRYIVQKVVGEMTRQAAMKYNLQAHAKGRELGINRYLVDLTEARNTETGLGNYEFAYRDMKETPGIDRRAKVAVLVAPGDHSHDFIETLARNTGLDVTLFTDREEAIAHLVGSS